MLAFFLTMLTYLTFLIHIIFSNVEMVDNKCCPKKTLGEKEYVLVDYDEKAAELSGCLTPCVYVEVEDLEFKRICFKEGDLFPQCDAEFDPFAPPQDRRLRSASSESKSWMKAVDGNTRLHELSIPGTHDTMSWKGPGQTIWSYTQSLTLKDQLEMGVRFLDIRLNIRGGELGCYHDYVYCDNNLRNVMSDIYKFLLANPTETVIYRFKIEGKLKESQNTFCQMFNDMIYPYRHYIYSYRYSNPEWLTYLPTLDQMRGKMVILNYNGYDECFGYRIDWIVLDNWNGKGQDWTGHHSNPDIVSVGRRRKRQVTDFTNGAKNEKAEESHEANTGNQIIDTKNISTSMSEDYLSESFEDSDTITVDLTTIPNLREFRRFNNTYSLPRDQKERFFWFFIPWIITAAVVTTVVVSAIYSPSDEYKKQLTDFQDQVRSSTHMDKMMVNFASASDLKCHPKRIAQDVNPHLHDYFGRNPTGRTGVVVFDYPTNWHHDLMKRIYKRNFKVCAQVYEHWNYEGDSYQLRGEHNDLTKIGWNDRISSIRIFPGCKLIWYEHTNFNGASRWNTAIRTYTIGWTSMSGWGSTGNDKISSMKCEYH
eukprot:GFUD01059588.1.p1 GENE.GFUD01059588.1~~GFUD01059588.1.p1  ORF type:complete len:593 (+),score=61.44 GFUD01059588.1:101-1879(+)